MASIAKCSVWIVDAAGTGASVGTSAADVSGATRLSASSSSSSESDSSSSSTSSSSDSSDSESG